MFKKENWLPNLFMLLASIFFTGVILTVIFKEIVPRLRELGHDETEILVPESVQIYKMPHIEPIPEDGSMATCFFSLSDSKDGTILYHTEAKDPQDIPPPSKLIALNDIPVPPDYYAKNLDFFFSFHHKVLKKFPQINLKSLSENTAALQSNGRGKYYYKTTSTDGTMLVYLIFTKQ